MLPIDIAESIRSKVHEESEVNELLKLCIVIKGMQLNVGNDQLIRAALVLSNYKSRQLNELMESKFKGDPRDVLVEANMKESNFNFGNNTFGK